MAAPKGAAEGGRDVDINLLVEFLALARHLNFSRTAQALNLTQPTLSRHISQLEEALSVQLFRRDRQSVALTEAGELFFGEASAVVARYETAMRRMQEYRDNMSGSLVIGYRWIYHGGAWPHVLHVFREQHPQVTVRLISFQDAGSLPDAVRDGSLDIAIVLRTDDVLPSEFRGLQLKSVPLVAVFRDSHPLARSPVVTPAQLAHERLLVPQTRSSMGLPAKMTALFRSYGLSPAVTYSQERLEEAMLRVQMDNLVGLMPQCYVSDEALPGVRVVQVAGTSGFFNLAVLAGADNPNAAVRSFLQTCRTELKRQRRAEQLGNLPE